MLEGALDAWVMERATVAIFDFDEELADKSAREYGMARSKPRLSWEDLCEVYPAIADAYRGRARVALLAVIGVDKAVN